MKDHKDLPIYRKQNREIFLRELFKALPNKIGLRNVILRRAYRSSSALFIFYFGIASQSDVVEPGDDNDVPLLCHPMSARAKLRCRADSVVSFQSPSFVLEHRPTCIILLLLWDIVRKKL